jgi:hypothetical protein
MTDRSSYGRYCFIRGHQALWKGDPAISGSEFRQVVITSNDWNANEGTFQVYAIGGRASGLAEATLAVSREPALLYDGDFATLEAAGHRFAELVKEAKAQGFKSLALFDEMDFQPTAKRRLT